MRLNEILRKASRGAELSQEEVAFLLGQKDGARLEIRAAADEMNQKLNGPVVTYIINRNINYTNLCWCRCKFCGFYRTSEAADAYTMDVDTILGRIALAPQITEVCIQGGLNPRLSLPFFVQLLKEIKASFPHLHIHAFSPMEIYDFSRRFDVGQKELLSLFRLSGLDSLCGTAAEILSDRIRQRICPGKLSTTDWVKIIETAHKLGIFSTATIMFGHLEGEEELARHLFMLKEIQMKTKGFTEFIPLPFVPYNTALGKEQGMREMVSWENVAHFLAVSRLFFQDTIKNIQTSWVKLGLAGAVATLHWGVNDLGGTLYEENISRSAGADHGSLVTPEEFRQAILNSGRIPKQRDTLYNLLG